MAENAAEDSYFKALREEAEDFLKAQRPTPSVHVRKPSSTDQVEELLAENAALRRLITELQAENTLLRHQLTCSLSPSSGETRGEDLSPGELLRAASALEEDLQVSVTALATQHMSLQSLAPAGFELSKRELAQSSLLEMGEELRTMRAEVHKHKAFIRQLKEALLQVVGERKRERTAYQQLKLEVQRLRKG